MTSHTADHLGARLSELVASYHRDHPLRPGVTAAEAASRLQLGPEVLSLIVELSEGLSVEGAHVRSTSFTGVRSEGQEAAWERTRQLLVDRGPGAAPRVDELEIGIELVHALVREGELVRISEDFVLLPSQVDSLLSVVASFESPFTVSEFRDTSGLSRKYAVPFLEWSDRAGHTVRQGDTRRAR